MSYIINIELRNKTFYLIKKYTSYSVLKKAFLLDEQFVDAFESQLRNPTNKVLNNISNYEQLRHENEYINYLDCVSSVENSLEQLFKDELKSEIYSSIFQDGLTSMVFGRYGSEQGLENDIFYQELGMKSANGNLYETNQQTKYIKGILEADIFWLISCITLFKGEYSIPNEYKIYNKWSYESLFGAKHWPLFRNFPAYIESAPDFNLNAQNEITSGEEIITTGIYEPWFSKPVYQSLSNDPDYNPYVGCPNYFLDGAIATQYKLEGTEDWYEVKWRLIWPDQRYVDGLIPEEEQFYNFDLETTSQSEPPIQPTIKVRAGQPSPKTGYWTTPAKPDHRQYIKQGELLPTLEDADWGEVYWYWDGE